MLDAGRKWYVVYKKEKAKHSQSLESEHLLSGHKSRVVLELRECGWLGEIWTTEKA